MLKLHRDTKLALLGMCAVVLLVCALSFAVSPQQPSTEHAQSEAIQQPDSTSLWSRTASDPLSLYTAVLAAFTIVLACASIYQGWITRRSVDLARDEFNATHRPRVVVTNFSLRKDLVDGGMVSLCFTARNAGDSPCRITEIRSATFTLDPNEKIPSDYSFPFVEKFNFTLAAGGGNEIFPANGAHTLEQGEGFSIFEGTRVLYCIGTITYEGTDGAREMGFCRRHFPSDHWEPTNSEYEYSY